MYGLRSRSSLRGEGGGKGGGDENDENVNGGSTGASRGVRRPASSADFDDEARSQSRRKEYNGRAAGHAERTVTGKTRRKGAEEEEEEENQVFKRRMKVAALVLLTLQNGVAVVCQKYSRTDAARDGSGALYLTSTAVALGELFKLVVSAAVIVQRRGFGGLGQDVREDIVQKPRECAKMMFPSLLYTVQNSLVLAAMSHVSAATFQITMQLKILVSALFSIALFGRVLPPYKWKGLVILTIGCAFVNLDQSLAGERQQKAQLSLGGVLVGQGGGGFWVGLAMTITAACISGFAGVYTEMLLKSSATSLWIRQIQMAFGGCIVGFAGCYVRDGASIRDGGFFQGYTPFTVFIVVFSASGGLIIAVVMKYADNIYKAFAVSLSIILSTIISIPVFGFSVSMLFFLGAGIVITSIFFYEGLTEFSATSHVLLAVAVSGAAIAAQQQVSAI